MGLASVEFYSRSNFIREFLEIIAFPVWWSKNSTINEKPGKELHARSDLTCFLKLQQGLHFMHFGLRPSVGVASESICARWHLSMTNLIISQEYSGTIDIDPIKDEQNWLERPREMTVGVRHVHRISTLLLQIPVECDGNGAFQPSFLLASLAEFAHL